jgi:TldD protein
MHLNRRSFLKTGAAMAAIATVPRPLYAQFDGKLEPLPPIEDPRLATLAARALDSAKSAGARYADVRLTHTRTRRFFVNATFDDEDMEVGVRALVQGYWGFASGPVWSPDEMVRLGREAVHQAKTNALGKPRLVTLAPAPVVQNGNWVMPVKLDPFDVSPFEIQDQLSSLELVARNVPFGSLVKNNVVATVQEKAFASTVGSYCTQRCYLTQGDLVVGIDLTPKHRANPMIALDCVSPAGMGWELYAADSLPRVRNHSLQDEVVQRLEEARADGMLPVKALDVGRFDTVLDATGIANLIDGTLGHATELDRALGYEANAGGTSYLNDPFAMLGVYQAGAPMLSLTANRSEPGAAATVKWDDEGIVPDEFSIVKSGVLVDFQTTRESAGWLQEANTNRGVPARSHGCSAAPSAVDAQMQHVPNLAIVPGRDASGDFDTLVSGMADGVAIKQASLDMDFQAGSGLGFGDVFEVKKGKRVAKYQSAGFLFRSTDLWKSLLTISGDAHLRRIGFAAQKGEPPQTCYHSVTGAPAVLKGLTLIDPLRKA